MNVAEFIAHLQTLPQNLQVLLNDSEAGILYPMDFSRASIEDVDEIVMELCQEYGVSDVNIGPAVVLR